MYETVEEARNAAGQTAKVEETVLFAREVVGNAADRICSTTITCLGLALLTKLFY